MTPERQSLQRVPTLTEVLQLAPPAAPAPPPEALASAPVAPGFDEAEATQRVLEEVQRRVDLMLEYRLRETLVPVLARMSDALVRELRDELASTLRDVVARAVAQEVARQRGR